MQPSSIDQLLTPAEVAAILFVDPKTVTRWARAGKLDAIRTPGGHRRYLKSDVLAIMRGQHASQKRDPAQTEPRSVEIASQRDPSVGRGGDLTAGALASEVVASELEAEAERAAEDVATAAAAVAAAVQKAAVAAARAREARALAAADRDTEPARRVGGEAQMKPAGVAIAERQTARPTQVPTQRGS